MTNPSPRRTGSLRMVEKYTGGTNVVILASGKSDKDPYVKNRSFAVPPDKLWLIKDVEGKKLPIENVEFTADKNGFLTGLWISKDATAGNGTASTTPAKTIQGSAPAANETPPPQTPKCGVCGGTVFGKTFEDSAFPGTKFCLTCFEKRNTPPLGNGKAPAASPAPDTGKDDAHQDPAWIKEVDKESWLRYIASLNTSNKILEGLWQPDPAKPQAEQIADKIEWVQSVAAGIRRNYGKEQGGA